MSWSTSKLFALIRNVIIELIGVAHHVWMIANLQARDAFNRTSFRDMRSFSVHRRAVRQETEHG
ncbi:hypothetical protein RIEGSTA812A_PEG_428 [invertebrate metagenome]|uniref:Uncharacterized protein n=1 Tax=invertebrate metagenome TaxID=1711999 RepID=A0A484H6H7_9ZZZZ